jgi:hypothetical protein
VLTEGGRPTSRCDPSSLLLAQPIFQLDLLVRRASRGPVRGSSIVARRALRLVVARRRSWLAARRRSCDWSPETAAVHSDVRYSAQLVVPLTVPRCSLRILSCGLWSSVTVAARWLVAHRVSRRTARCPVGPRSSSHISPDSSSCGSSSAMFAVVMRRMGSEWA